MEKYVSINNGIVTGDDKKFLSKEMFNNGYKKIIRGKNIKRYSVLEEQEYVFYDREKLLRARDELIFLADEKLIMQMINIEFVITYDKEQFYNLGTTYAITSKEKFPLKFLLTLLNSSLFKFYYLKKFTNESSLTNAISTQNLFLIPIKNISNDNQQPFIDKADIMLSKNKELQQANTHFQKLLTAQFPTLNINTKLEKWYSLSFADFNKELTKQKIKLSLTEQSEWLSFFEQQQQKALAIKNEIDTTDAEIDKMVYALYGLTDEEVRIVEGG